MWRDFADDLSSYSSGEPTALSVSDDSDLERCSLVRRRIDETMCRCEGEIAEVGHVGDIYWYVAGTAEVEEGLGGGLGAA